MLSNGMRLEQYDTATCGTPVALGLSTVHLTPVSLMTQHK